MLRELYIKNYLMMPEIRLPFAEGLTVISGETGAGKSILVGSIALIFGDNAPGVEAYDPKQPVYLEATLQVNDDPALHELLRQCACEDSGEIVVAREISSAGKSSYFLNGRKVAVAVVKELRPLLIDFHHQRDQQKLLSPAVQLDLLDAYAGGTDQREAFAMAFRQLKSDLHALEALKADALAKARMKELYQFQYDELSAAKLTEGEEGKLQQEYELLSHAQEIAQTTLEIREQLFETENAIYDQLNTAYARLEHYKEMNPQLQEAAQCLAQSMQMLQDTDKALVSLDGLENADPDRLELIQARLDEINALSFKHKLHNTGELIALMKQRESEINAYESRDQEIEILQKKLDKDYLALRRAADELSMLRAKAIPALASELQMHIRELSIPQALLEITIDKKTQLDFVLPEFIAAVTESGQDCIQFMFSANAGFALKPLAAVASGGELSRILLAIKKVLAAKMPSKLMILDEIDSGIGGKTAGRVAQFMSSLARRQQVLAITHLAQIAAVADDHQAIEKLDNKERGQIRIRTLSADDRLLELARMLSGSLGPKALEHAKEMISEINKRG